MRRNLPRTAPPAETFWSALEAGALDACLAFARGDDGAADASANCRLAERLLHGGRGTEAIECGRRALAAAQDDPTLLSICAWVFSNTGCHDEAAASYRRLLEWRPEWIDGHRHLSSALAAAGHADDALEEALLACELAPRNSEFMLHTASLLLADARGDEAADFARYAASLVPDEPDVAVDAAELLMRCDRVSEAAALLANAASEHTTARLLRVLSAAEMTSGRLDAALRAIEAALTCAPDNPEFELHRGHLLWQLGDIPGAAQAFDRAAALDPAGRDIKRARMSLYAAAGMLQEATATGGDLLHRFPEDRPAAEAVLHLLNHRLDTIDGDCVVLARGADREPRPRHPPPGLLDRMRNQQRIVTALIIRETRTRFAEFRLGYGWALIEPILHIALLSATFALLMHGRPPIGQHFFLFYYTGLIPYLMFTHTSSGMSHAVTGNAAVLQLPTVTSFDVIAARGLLEMTTDMVVAVILLAAFAAVGVAALPDDLWAATIALLVTAAFGCGFGFVNAVVTVFWRSWEKVYGQVARILYFISGIFYVPGMMPDWARDALAWNPLLHAVDWFRAGFFASYRPHWLDRPYLVTTAIVSLLAGLTLQRGLRRRLSVPL